MKNMKLNVCKVLLAIALLSPAALADDGEMGSGGLTGTNPVVIPVKPERTAEDGEMGSGGRTVESASYFDSVLQYFEMMF